MSATTGGSLVCAAPTIRPRLPAVILVRGGSQRLKDKWSLPWWDRRGRATTLLENTVRVVLACRHVSLVYVGTDDDAIVRTIQRTFGHETCEANAREPSGFTRVECIKRPRVEATQPSLEALRWVLDKARLEASYALLVQCTFPFGCAADLDRLIETWWDRRGESAGLFLARPDDPARPAGFAWVVCPARGYDSTSPVAVTTPCFDIDYRADYTAAVAEYRRLHDEPAHAALAH